MVDKGPLLTSAIIFYLSIGAAIFQVLEEPNWKLAAKQYSAQKVKILKDYPCLTEDDLNRILEVWTCSHTQHFPFWISDTHPTLNHVNCCTLISVLMRMISKWITSSVFNIALQFSLTWKGGDTWGPNEPQLVCWPSPNTNKTLGNEMLSVYGSSLWVNTPTLVALSPSLSWILSHVIFGVVPCVHS